MSYFFSLKFQWLPISYDKYRVPTNCAHGRLPVYLRRLLSPLLPPSGLCSGQSLSSVPIPNPHQHASVLSVFSHFAVRAPHQSFSSSLPTFPKQNGGIFPGNTEATHATVSAVCRVNNKAEFYPSI